MYVCTIPYKYRPYTFIMDDINICTYICIYIYTHTHIHTHVDESGENCAE